MNPRLLAFRSLWGCESIPGGNSSFGVLLPALKKLGYDGIEASLGDLDALATGPWSKKTLDFCAIAKDLDLQLICGVYSSWQDYEAPFIMDLPVKSHVLEFRRQLERAAQLPLKPLKINAHSGSDCWTSEQHEEYFREVLPIGRGLGLDVNHETHRGRSLFHPLVTHRLLQRFPELRLTADFSHWLLVCERPLTSPAEARLMRDITARVGHVHARVGHTQHAQIRDVDAPEHAADIAQHVQWWQWAWQAQAARGEHVCTVTPEYGPAPYAPYAPTADTAASRHRTSRSLWEVTNAALHACRRDFAAAHARTL